MPEIIDEPVSRFPSVSEDPMGYPGRRPASSYVTNGDSVHAMELVSNTDGIHAQVLTGDGTYELSAFLETNEATPLDGRYPVLAYGSNVNPGTLREKLANTGELVVPVMYVSLPNYDVVWSDGPGIRGNFIAFLHDGQEVTGTHMQAAITWLTFAQVQRMKETEKDYVARQGELVIGTDFPMPMYLYAGTTRIYVEGGKPVALAGVNATDRHLEQATNRQMLEKILGRQAILQAIRERYANFPNDDASPEAYIAFVRSLRKQSGTSGSPRNELKVLVRDQIIRLGLSREISTGTQLPEIADASAMVTYEQIRTGAIPPLQSSGAHDIASARHAAGKETLAQEGKE